MLAWFKAHTDNDIRVAHRLASTWVAGFWGAFGMGLTLMPIFVTMDNVIWLGPILMVVAASFAIARFTKQPGAEL